MKKVKYDLCVILLSGVAVGLIIGLLIMLIQYVLSTPLIFHYDTEIIQIKVSTQNGLIGVGIVVIAFIGLYYYYKSYLYENE